VIPVETRSGKSTSWLLVEALALSGRERKVLRKEEERRKGGKEESRLNSWLALDT